MSYDRATREGVGLLVNQCGLPVAAEVLVMANNRDGFVVAKLRTYVHAGAAPLSVIRVDLPFVQSVVVLSGYAVEVATATGVENGEQAAAPMLESRWTPSL